MILPLEFVMSVVRKIFLLALLVIPGLIGFGLYFGFGYSRADIKVALNYMAKDYCSCIFVQELDPEWCKESLFTGPLNPDFRFDKGLKQVNVSSFVFFSSRADYRGSVIGCALPPQVEE